MTNIDQWKDDSILSRNGYAADGSLTELGRRFVLNKIINNNDDKVLLEAINHFKFLIEFRGDRMPKAKRIWEEDLVYFCNKMNEKHNK